MNLTTQSSSVMVGGDGANSYAKNSYLQRNIAIAAKEAMAEALMEALDMPTLLSTKSTKLVTIADLGCSVGPNTLVAMQEIIDIVATKCHMQGIDPKTIEFQVFFNDQITNDFNTLFASIPNDKNYFAAGVPGSFYDILFPSSSIHIAYSSCSLHWLSKVPKDLEDENSPAWNRGRIHYKDAPEAVLKAYTKQFEKDIDDFLKARAREIVSGGVIVALLPGVRDEGIEHDVGVMINFLGDILIEMVKKGLLKHRKVDAFNIPNVYPSLKEMRRIVENNGSFRILRMELVDVLAKSKKSRVDMTNLVMHLRAFTEPIVASHMGHEIVEEIFTRALEQKEKLFQMFYSDERAENIGLQLFFVLQRKP
ncbi:loganic acid O-methyltransferase-like [Andrographis paniculata]|uniref:loganic acid O-methyltransferase-like n=1 Tax=Andrographis paniculata TaxID=175694 RepID=UPI0021E9486D|nr:loganic acid O-methyltransferase-like [Andrographis paniculata]